MAGLIAFLFFPASPNDEIKINISHKYALWPGDVLLFTVRLVLVLFECVVMVYIFSLKTFLGFYVKLDTGV